MKTIYCVVEGVTDQVIIEGLMTSWLGEEEFIWRAIQPPLSASMSARLSSKNTSGTKPVYTVNK